MKRVNESLVVSSSRDSREIVVGGMSEGRGEVPLSKASLESVVKITDNDARRMPRVAFKMRLRCVYAIQMPPRVSGRVRSINTRNIVIALRRVITNSSIPLSGSGFPSSHAL